MSLRFAISQAEERLARFLILLSCHAKRLEEWGEWIREKLLLDVPHRTWAAFLSVFVASMVICFGSLTAAQQQGNPLLLQEMSWADVKQYLEKNDLLSLFKPAQKAASARENEIPRLRGRDDRCLWNREKPGALTVMPGGDSPIAGSWPN